MIFNQGHQSKSTMEQVLGDVPAVAAEGEIASQVSMTGNLLGELRNALMAMESLLSPILSQTNAKTPPRADGKYESPMANILSAQNDAIHDMLAWAHDIHQRIRL